MSKFSLKVRSTVSSSLPFLICAALLGAPYIARAQDNKRIVVGTWGGDYSRLLAKNIETPLLVPKGWDVIKDEAGDPPRRAKVLEDVEHLGEASRHLVLDGPHVNVQTVFALGRGLLGSLRVERRRRPKLELDRRPERRVLA